MSAFVPAPGAGRGQQHHLHREAVGGQSQGAGAPFGCGVEWAVAMVSIAN